MSDNILLNSLNEMGKKRKKSRLAEYLYHFSHRVKMIQEC